MRNVAVVLLTLTVAGPAAAAGPQAGSSPAENEKQPRLGKVYLQVSAELLAREVVRSVDQRLPVRDIVLGVPLRGHAHVRGTTKLVLLEDRDKGMFELVLSGTAVSETRGNAYPAAVHSHTVTRFIARKQVMLDAKGLHALPATCHAESQIAIRHVSSSLGGLRGRLARRIAWQRAQAQKAAAERITAQHCERRICRGFDADVARDVREANDWLAEQLQKSDLAGSPVPRQPRFETSSDRLRVSGLTADVADLSAVRETLERANIAVRLLVEGNDLVLALSERGK